MKIEVKSCDQNGEARYKPTAQFGRNILERIQTAADREQRARQLPRRDLVKRLSPMLNPADLELTEAALDVLNCLHAADLSLNDVVQVHVLQEKENSRGTKFQVMLREEESPSGK